MSGLMGERVYDGRGGRSYIVEEFKVTDILTIPGGE